MSSLKRNYAVMIPCVNGEVDYTPFVELVHHPEFQVLARRSQLGRHVPHVFPGGLHSRYEHSLGVFHGTKQRLARLVAQGYIPETQTNVLLAYALLHDIGHGPMSHGIEPITSITHKQNGARILRLLEEVLARIGIPVSREIALIEKRDPLSAVVSDKMLGADMFDYLERDGHHTGQKGFKLASIMSHIVYLDGALGIDKAVTPELIRLMQDYAFMYSRVYLATPCRLYERVTAKMAEGLMRTGLPEDALWRMTDGELDGAFERSGDDDVRFLYQRYRVNADPQAVCVVCPEGTGRYQTLNGEVDAIRELTDFPIDIPLREAHRLSKELERQAAEILGLGEHDVLVTPPIPRDRFRPQDVAIWDHGRRESLREQFPYAFEGIEQLGVLDAGFRFSIWNGDPERAKGRLDDLVRMTEETFAVWTAAGQKVGSGK